DVKPVVPARENLFGDRERKVFRVLLDALGILLAGLAGPEDAVRRLQHSSCNRALHCGPCSAPVAEEIGLSIDAIARLVMHIQPPPGKGDESECNEQRLPHPSTSATSNGCSVVRNSFVPFKSNFGSLASMHRKNRSLDARLNRGALKTG